MKRYSLCLALITAMVLNGCGKQPADTFKAKQEIEINVQSNVEKDNCFICGTPAGGLLEYYYKFNSIGIIHWADMSVTDTQVLAFDDDGKERIDKSGLSMRMDSFGEGYGSINCDSQSNRGISEPMISLKEKDELDYEMLKDKLCQECLDKVCGFYEEQVNSGNEKYRASTGYSLIDFQTRELYPLSQPYSGYSVRDFMVKYEMREQADGGKYIDALIFYAPERREKNN